LFGLGSIAHALALLASTAQITQTEVAAKDSRRSTSGFAMKRRAQKPASDQDCPPRARVLHAAASPEGRRPLAMAGRGCPGADLRGAETAITSAE
jgi:hypothetical protein